MQIGILNETAEHERRVALVPAALRALRESGAKILVEAGAGEAAGFPDAQYAQAGARLIAESGKLLREADLVLCVAPPAILAQGGAVLDGLREGAVLLGLLRPLDEPELARHLAARRITAFALELLPRITRAQPMDVLSSMSTLAGYRAVLLAAEALPKLFPMLVTAAGTISPARVLVIGAGVAGLQAVATARRLGAVVEAYDTRPAVKEQVESLGARFVELPLTAQGAEAAGGYAAAQAEDFLKQQRELLAVHVQRSDVVITTALVPGHPAPHLIDEGALAGMRPGSVVVDLAAPAGGNCAATRRGQTIKLHGVQVIGPENLPAQAATDASQMLSKNFTAFLQHIAPKEELALDLSDEITRATLLTHEGEIMNTAVRERLARIIHEAP